MARLVKMVRHKQGFTAPYSANVHPKEVKNFLTAGWVKSENSTTGKDALEEAKKPAAKAAGQDAKKAVRKTTRRRRSASASKK